MKVMKQNRKTKYTQMVLQDALMALMTEKSIFKITVTELCERADINRTTFYAHYADPYDLLQKIEAEVLLSVSETINPLHKPLDRASTVQIIQTLLQYIVNNEKSIQILLSERGDHNFQKALLTILYEKCELSGQQSNTSIEAFRFIFILDGSIGLIRHWLKTEPIKSTKEIAEIIVNMSEK